MKGDMTQGNISKVLITFAVPMALGNVFQQLYNTTDAIIVGRLLGKNALAAVGVANPVMSIAIFFIAGMCIGISVLESQFFGAEKYKLLKREVSTALLSGLGFTLVLSVVFIFISKWVLLITGTPIEILEDANIYLKIIFSGLIFSYLYNFCSTSLMAIGDSKTPLICLIISCVLNGILCILFIAVFKLGVAGSAMATVAAQCISSLLCIGYVYMKIPIIRLNVGEFTIDKNLLLQTIQYSWVSSLQQISLYIGKLLVQGAVNPFGTNAIAAFNSVTRVDALVLGPGDSLAASTATFCAQNKGGRKWHRIIEGYKTSNMIITAYCTAMALIVFFRAQQIMGMFISGSESEVIMLGVKYLKLMCIFYILSGFCNIFQGLFRGAGLLKITFIATILQMTVRVGLSYALAAHLGLQSVCYAVAAGWVCMIIYEGLCSKKYFNELRRSMKSELCSQAENEFCSS